MSNDAALAFFLDDAKAQGLTLAEYERKYGIILDMPLPPPAKHRILRNEVPGGLMTREEIRLARHKEKRRAGARRRSKEPIEPVDTETAAEPS